MQTRIIVERDTTRDIKSIQIISPESAILIARNSQIAGDLLGFLRRFIRGAKSEGRAGYLFTLDAGSSNEQIVVKGDLKQMIGLLSASNFINKDTSEKVDSQIEEVSKEFHKYEHLESKEKLFDTSIPESHQDTSERKFRF